MSEEHWSRRNSVAIGVGLGVLLHSCQIVIVPLLSVVIPELFVFALMAWSLTQFLYLVPAIVIARRAGRNETAKGLILVAAIGILLNGACDALLFGSFGKHPLR
jgi:hypothetical protein